MDIESLIFKLMVIKETVAIAETKEAVFNIEQLMRELIKDA